MRVEVEASEHWNKFEKGVEEGGGGTEYRECLYKTRSGAVETLFQLW